MVRVTCVSKISFFETEYIQFTRTCVRVLRVRARARLIAAAGQAGRCDAVLYHEKDS